MPQSEFITGVVVAVAVDADGPIQGALLLGSPGAGKSSIALGLIEACPWRRSGLVADDGVQVSVKNGKLVATPPAAIAGLLEVRGFGPTLLRSVPSVTLLAGFNLDLEPRRLPDPDVMCILQQNLTIWPLVPGLGAAQRVRVILRAILAGQTP